MKRKKNNSFKYNISKTNNLLNNQKYFLWQKDKKKIIKKILLKKYNIDSSFFWFIGNFLFLFVILTFFDLFFNSNMHILNIFIIWFFLNLIFIFFIKLYVNFKCKKIKIIINKNKYYEITHK